MSEKHFYADERITPDQLGLETQQDFYHPLEEGKIIVFPHLPFSLLPTEKRFLNAHAVNGKRKNISFNAITDCMKGDAYRDSDHDALKNMLQRYHEFSKHVIQTLFSAYWPQCQLGRTSFRPVEAAHRESLSPRKDDRRLHIDAFPASPNQGKRLLRVFTNINPDKKNRVWRVGESFTSVAKQFNAINKKSCKMHRKLMQLLSLTRGYRSDYDVMMLQLHDAMKLDEHYQKTCDQTIIKLPPGATWVVFTDQASHAAMSGQHCLEQTFYLPVSALLYPQYSPLHVLEKMAGRKLV